MRKRRLKNRCDQEELRSLRKVGTSCPEWRCSFVVLQKGIIERATIKERTDMNAQITTAAKTRRYLKRISTSISLVILTLGFSFLGLLTLINSNRGGVVNTLSFEDSSAVVGSSVSILLGVAFLVAASLYWSRYSRIMD
jgi:uncharacterized membrane protein YidH (DUF202 family)